MCSFLSGCSAPVRESSVWITGSPVKNRKEVIWQQTKNRLTKRLCNNHLDLINPARPSSKQFCRKRSNGNRSQHSHRRLDLRLFSVNLFAKDLIQSGSNYLTVRR